jgi:hypothetical protein
MRIREKYEVTQIKRNIKKKYQREMNYLEKPSKKRFKIFLYQVYLNALKDINLKDDKVLFAKNITAFFKQEINSFWANNDFEKPRLDFKRLESLSYTEITREIYDWYLGEIVLGIK